MLTTLSDLLILIAHLNFNYRRKLLARRLRERNLKKVFDDRIVVVDGAHLRDAGNVNGREIGRRAVKKSIVS